MGRGILAGDIVRGDIGRGYYPGGYWQGDIIRGDIGGGILSGGILTGDTNCPVTVGMCMCVCIGFICLSVCLLSVSMLVFLYSLKIFSIMLSLSHDIPGDFSAGSFHRYDSQPRIAPSPQFDPPARPSVRSPSPAPHLSAGRGGGGVTQEGCWGCVR